MIEAIQRVTVCVRDQDRALEFYVSCLGFEKRDDEGDPTGYRWLTVAPPGSLTEIYLAKAGPGEQHAESEVGGQTGIMLRTRNLALVYKELSQQGVEFPQLLTLQPWGGAQAQVADPDGNIFFLQEQPSSDQSC